MMLFIKLFPLILTVGVLAEEHRKVGDSSRLFDFLFGEGRYHKEIRPVLNQSLPVHVEMRLLFKQVLRVDEVDQVVTVYIWIEEYWKDEYLEWNPEDFGGIETLHVPVNLVWQPDLLIYNNANMHIKDNQHESNVLMSSSGHVSVFRALITDIACSLDMTYFPFDEQVCFIKYASWSFDGTKLYLTSLDSEQALTTYMENSEWTRLDFKHKMNIRFYECCRNPYPELVYYFSLKRNPNYYILSLIIPSSFITIVTIVGFFIPHSSTGENTEKVSLGVTALLSLAIILLMVADKMPATSQVLPLIGKYYIGLIIVIILATCATVMTLNIQMRGNNGRPISPTLKSFFFNNIARYIRFKVNLTNHNSTEYTDPNEANEAMFLMQSQYLAEEETRMSTDRPLTINWDQRQRKISNSSTRRSRSLKSAQIEGSEGILGQISDTVARIQSDYQEELRLKMVRKEWEELARLCERILMFTFVGLTLLFAVITLSTRGPAIVLTDKLMSSATN